MQRYCFIRVWISLLGMVFLAACASPSLPLLKGTRAEVSVGGMDFVVYYTDTRAEAIRVSTGKVPERRLVLAGAMYSIEKASGCKVMAGSLYGDWTLVEAFLTCPGKPSGRLRPVMVYEPPMPQ